MDQRNSLYSEDTVKINGITHKVQTFLNSITGLPQYEHKSYEELRWEDYIINNKFPKNPPPPTQTQTIHINNNSFSTNSIGTASNSTDMIAPAATSRPSTSANNYKFDFSPINEANFSSIKANPSALVSTSANSSSNLFDSSSIRVNLRNIPSFNPNSSAPSTAIRPSTAQTVDFSDNRSNFSNITPIKSNPTAPVTIKIGKSSSYLFDSSSAGPNLSSITPIFNPNPSASAIRPLTSANSSSSLAVVASLINQAQATEPKKALFKPETQLKDSLIFQYQHNRPKITIEKGSVFECNVDVVVNSINTTLDPDYSLTSAFTKLIGDDFKNQLKNYSSLKYIRNLAIYQFAITTNHFNWFENIPFANVFNCCINDFDYVSDISEIHYKNTILESLKLTEKYSLTSIAIPVIGCSKKKYPPHLVAKWIDETIEKYMLTYSYISSLETIRIILDKGNPSVVDSFQRYYNEKLSIQNLLPSNHKTLIDEYELIKVNSNSDEYKHISKHFALTMGSATIDKIERVLNSYQEEMYETNKKNLKQKNQENQAIEYNLFHGTNKESIDLICKLGFNRSLCGKNGTVYGQGCYFARDASYSHRYSLKDESLVTTKKSGQNFRQLQMLYCSVLVGAYHQTNSSSYKDTDLRSDGKQYDSSVDNLANPTIFVVYRDHRAIPKYLIHYSCALS